MEKLSTNFELFRKDLSGLFKDIYDNQQNKNQGYQSNPEMKKIINMVI